MATSVTEIFNTVGAVIVDAMVSGLISRGENPLSSSSELVKSIDYDISFQENDIKTGKFKSLSLFIFMNEYGLALDKGRQGIEGNRGIQTKWKSGKVTGIPISALIKFIKARGLQSKIKGKKGRFTSINQIAFILQRSIKMSGITPRNFIIPALEEGQKKLKLFIDRDLLDILTVDLVNAYR